MKTLLGLFNLTEVYYYGRIKTWDEYGETFQAKELKVREEKFVWTFPKITKILQRTNSREAISEIGLGMSMW